MALVENIQREENLNAIEVAISYKRSDGRMQCLVRRAMHSCRQETVQR